MNPVKDIKYLHDIIYKNNPECRYDGGPRFLPEEVIKTRIMMLYEEVDEYQIASAQQNMEEILDALIDLIVFAVGTAYLHGFTDIFEEAWSRVLNANLKKFAGNKGRGSDCDMIKPENWKPPTFKDLI